MITPDSKIEDVFKEVARGVKLETNGEQEPWTASSLTEDFYFASSQQP